MESSVNESYFDSELKKSLRKEVFAGRLRFIDCSQRLFEKMARQLPLDGSRVDWARTIRFSEEHFGSDDSAKIRFMIFFDKCLAQIQLRGDIFYVGDALTELAIAGDQFAMRKALPQILQVPQHHYFMDETVSWCLALSMEGDAGFGLSPLAP